MNAARLTISLFLIACYFAPAEAQRRFPFPSLIVRDLVHGELEDGKSIQLEAWVSFSGELKLYDSQEAADLDLIYPYCISGSFPDYALNRNPDWHDKRVRVTGTVLLPDEPSKEPNTIQTMEVADGILFANGCWGRYVLRIDEIEVLEVPGRN